MVWWRQEELLFSSIKCWSNGPLASKEAEEADDELLSLIDEIRLENIPPQQLNQILDDSWMQQVGLAKSALQLTKLPLCFYYCYYCYWSHRVRQP